MSGFGYDFIQNKLQVTAYYGIYNKANPSICFFHDDATQNSQKWKEENKEENSQVTMTESHLAAAEPPCSR